MRPDRGLTAFLLVAMVLAGLAAGQFVHGTYSAPVFTAQAVNPGNNMNNEVLTAPSALQEAVDTSTAPYHVALAWTAATTGNGYVIDRALNSAGTCGAYTQVGTSTVASYLDTSGSNGSAYCYRIMTELTSGGSTWTSSFVTNPVTNAYTGFIAESWGWTNGGTALTIDTGDTLTVTFNTLVNVGALGTGRANLCAKGSTLELWETRKNGACSSGRLGTLSGATFSSTGRVSESDTNWVWSTITVNGVAKSTVTLTVSTNSGVSYSSSGQLETLTPSTSGSLVSQYGGLLPTTSCAFCTPTSTTNP